MDRPNQSDQPALQFDAGSEELKTRLCAVAQSAVARMDISECRRIVSYAERNPDAANLPALCALLKAAEGIRARRGRRRPDFVALRVAAIEAMRGPSAADCVPALTDVLLFDVGSVREAALKAFGAIGPHASAAIATKIASAPDWPLGGMLAAINALGATRDKVYAPFLAAMLHDRYPKVPSRWNRWQAVRTSCFVAGMTLLFSCMLISEREHIPGENVILLISCAVTMAVLGGGIFFLSAGRRQRKESAKLYAAAVDSLVLINEPSTVPDLIRVHGNHCATSARAASRGLASLLPLLNSDNADMIDDELERLLTNLLSSADDALILAIVKSLEFVGTGQSVARVERLLRNLPPYEDNPTMAKRNEAIRILPILHERKRQEEAWSHLLRPSQSPPGSGADLVRPSAGPSGEVEADQLMRPSPGEPEVV